MNTLIKWPGGKTREFYAIRQYLPNFKRYIEPFFGGGAIYFRLLPEIAIVNDISEDLIEFYRFITATDNKDLFKTEMYLYVDLWTRVGEVFERTKDKFTSSYLAYSQKQRIDQTLVAQIDMIIRDFFGLLFTTYPIEEIIDQDNLFQQIHKNLLSKIQRMNKIAVANGGISRVDIYDNLETAIRSGFYMHFRDMLNEKLLLKITREKYIANYYFIREFCYGSMFRYSTISGFNIPYGGIAYNKKNFQTKVDKIFSTEVQNQLSSTIFFNEDFEPFLKEIELNSDDFLFVDPPYDTDFSDYDQNNFGKCDQERLANILLQTPAKFLLVIKYTPFVMSLYEKQPGVLINNFYKQYAYNIKGRNDRNTEHLIITNYKN